MVFKNNRFYESEEIDAAIEFHKKIKFICADPEKTVIGHIHYANYRDKSFYIACEDEKFRKIPFNKITYVEVLQ